MKIRAALAWSILGILLATGCGGGARKTVASQAVQFFDLLRDGQLSEAYAMLAEESRRETTFEDFASASRALGFVGNRGVAWSAPYVDGDYAAIEGDVSARDGAVLRQELVFFRKNGAWAIHIVREAAKPDSAQTVQRVVDARLRQPDAEGKRRLAADTLRRLADALLAGDYADFHASLEPGFRNETSPELFRDSFQWLALPELGIDWNALGNALPEFHEPPEVDMNALLKMTGHVALGDKILGFEMLFAHSPPDWLLVSIVVRPPL